MDHLELEDFALLALEELDRAFTFLPVLLKP
jgi:hypothetical protein